MTGSAFDSTYYYRFSNTALGVNMTLAVGETNDPPNAPVLNLIRSFSSENWQIFYDQGIYFIRNWNYGATYQLGLTADERITPQLLATGPDLGMQWNLTMGEDGWIMYNMLLATDNMLGVDMSALNHTIPVMNTDTTGAQWSIDINNSAGKITNETMLQVFSPLPAATTTLPVSSTRMATIPTSTLTSTSEVTSAQKMEDASSSDSLSPGSIAGIVVSCVASIALILVIWFIIRRRRSQPQKQLLGPQKDEPFQLEGHCKTTELPGNVFNAEAPTNKVVNELPGETR
ncbi:uncharacterized protein N7484_004203 [Penicillium longicatenatum]|uniref:uncharacterized protein n=1 Tax=Penicillium longicatenatum TaxID=1561947 RepID=UPI0025484389|nr:uncharacterized protein N7484_004203 [Penicillium longicatenatum]KAJ5650480.1 hypothetical protein N7484_004203 [Penicillium longicatenatum]